MPKVSVICTTHNQAHYLSQAISSVLGQTYTDFELIIIDDGSTDNTNAIVENFHDVRIKYFWQENQERSIARNKGIQLSQGYYLTFLDADDCYLPEKLVYQTIALESNSEIGMVASGWLQTDQDCAPIRQMQPWILFPQPNLRDWLFFGLTIVGANLIRRELLESVGGFNKDLNALEDTYLWYELIRSGCKVLWVPEIVMMHRMHSKNTIRNADKMREANLTLLENIFGKSEIEAISGIHKSEAYSLAYLNSSFRYLNVGKTEEAKKDLSMAIHSDPSLLDNGGERIIINLWSWANDPKIDNSNKFIRLFLDNKPASVANLEWNKRRILSGIWIDKGYSAYSHGQMKTVRKSFTRALSTYPGWVKDRGFILKYLESILGESIFNQIRKRIIGISSHN